MSSVPSLPMSNARTSTPLVVVVAIFPSPLKISNLLRTVGAEVVEVVVVVIVAVVVAGVSSCSSPTLAPVTAEVGGENLKSVKDQELMLCMYGGE